MAYGSCQSKPIIDLCHDLVVVVLPYKPIRDQAKAGKEIVWPLLCFQNLHYKRVLAYRESDKDGCTVIKVRFR